MSDPTAAQHSTAQYSTVQHSTAQHSTAQHPSCFVHNCASADNRVPFFFFFFYVTLSLEMSVPTAADL
ncbi:hypothetical protein T484DRAFT_1960496 [Baffinella frigidus]|nr:hypothetical protein T484DRAFT_1960496 [Cryptophyta sp. CCMP2293]